MGARVWKLEFEWSSNIN